MSDFLNGVIIGAVIPIFMFIVSKIFDFIKLKSEEKRWYGEHLLKLRIDTLRNFKLVMEKCFFTYNKYLNLSPITEADYVKYVEGKSEEYRDAKVVADIYLNKDQDETLSAILRELRHADMEIIDSIKKNKKADGSSSPFTWDAFFDAHDNAKICLRELLNPDSFKNYLNNI